MDALDAILSKPLQARDAIENMLLQHDYPDEARKAAEKYASYQAIATAAREYIKVATFREANDLCYHCGADETMQHSKLCYYEQTRNKLAAALVALEQETK